MRFLFSLFLLAGSLAAQPSFTGLRILPNPAHTTPGYVRFFNNAATHYVGLKAPGTVAADISFTLPNALPGSTLCVFSDSSGILTTAACIVQGTGCITVSGTTVNSTCPNITYTNGNAINIVGSQINANYAQGTGISISGATISASGSMGSLNISTSGTLSTGAATVTGLTISGITGSTQCLQANSAGTVSGFGSGCGTITGGSSPITVSGANLACPTCVTTAGGQSIAGTTTFSVVSISNGLTVGFGGITLLTAAISGATTISASSTISTTGGITASGGVGAAGFNPTGFTGIASHTYTMTDAAGTGTCTIVVNGGVVTNGTC